jgi:hypothetical protein
VNRKQWIIAGIVLVLFAFGLLLLPKAGSSVAPTPSAAAPPAKLVYCSNEGSKPCVVSFGVDVRDNMLINLLLPDLSFPAFSSSSRAAELKPPMSVSGLVMRSTPPIALVPNSRRANPSPCA